ncbi:MULTISPECIES: diguanylate cyclase domain-containing protein [unclassified Colwellia]|uniref:GGDEF domain-containing response regulator n=1 Tax=unclassified Colwellia TaxID=196834 RepID=UPI0015F5E0F1|nr:MULTISPECIES: diguanylate cyclase [unclassified Colwellia]MBA6379504.1 diguanylate cyclase [Colwellia sp. BRX10-7]MBA6385763.1 diguanylate cyclase [Colwellia sp. BRX10-2]MBA6400715.1 diguanylate cyclase [Colwellia sp. BRX10-5]MBA6405325.1 diguanylate cyclase [Colwellia sp. BRX10-1]
MKTLEQIILIVDDDKANRKMLKELLQEQAKIIFAKNGKQARELARKHLPDLILLDVIMPDISGFEVIDSLKNDPKTINISVIFITGLANDDDEERGFNLGGCDYIYKPFKPNIVIARVMMHLELIRQRKMLDEIAHIDALTGVNNRRKMDLVLKDEVAANKYEHTNLLVAILDIDYFKQYNDGYGHGAGDVALRQVGQALREICVRPRDFIARYGGEEFVLILPDCDKAGAEIMLSNIAQAIKDKKIKHQYSSVSPQLTVSVGAVVVKSSQSVVVANVMKKADSLLYQAKNNGRNQYCLAELNELGKLFINSAGC